MQNDGLTLSDLYKNEINIEPSKTVILKDKAVDYDLLGRDLIIDELISTIKSCPTNEAFTIGIEGEWGSGKTTLINLAISKINDEKIEVIKDFDPWVFGTEEAMLSGFFEKILNALGIEFSSLKFKAELKTLIGVMADMSGKNWASQFLNTSRYNYSKSLELSELYKKLLINENKRIVFVIDNLDRMNGNQIIFLFKMLGTLFNLPNVVYVLAYDRDRLDDIFNGKLEINYKYKEKIINQIIYVPSPLNDKLENIYDTCITNLANHEKAEYVIDLMEYQDFLKVVVKTIDDLRSFTRFINSGINRILKENDTLDKIDEMILFLIKFQNLELYESIWNHANYFISIYHNPDENAFKREFQDFKDEQKKYFNSLIEKYEVYAPLLADMFPDFNKISHKETSVSYKRKFPIYSDKYFDLYFTRSFNDYHKIRMDLNEFIQEMNQYKDLNNLWKTHFDCLNDVTQLLWLEEFHTSLDYINNDLYYSVFMLFWKESLKFSRRQPFLRLSANQYACVIMERCIEKLTDGQINQVVDEIKNDFDKVYIASEIKYWLNASDSRATTEKIDKWTHFYNMMCEKILRNNINLFANPYYSRFNITGISRYLKNDMTRFSEYIKKQLAPQYVYRILVYTLRISASVVYTYSIDQNLFKEIGVNKEIFNTYLKRREPLNESENFIRKLFIKFYNDEAKCVISISKEYLFEDL